jgi:hypothetical protein
VQATGRRVTCAHIYDWLKLDEKSDTFESSGQARFMEGLVRSN